MPPTQFCYVRADEVWSRDGSMVGTVDATYEEFWLVDGRAGRPVRGTSGSVSWAITNFVSGTGNVNFVGVFAHNVSVPIGVSGAVTATIPAPVIGLDGIAYGSYALLDTAGDSSGTVTLGVTGNPLTVVMGEAVVGRWREFPRPIAPGASRSLSWDAVKPEGRVSSVLPYYDGIRRRTLSADLVLGAAHLDELRGMVEAERGGSRYTVLIPDPAVQDAWLVTCTSFTFEKHGPEYYDGHIEWTEQPSVVW